MANRLELVRATPDLTGEQMDDLFKSDSTIDGDSANPWDYNLGNPEMFRDVGLMATPGGRVLDVGAGTSARTSFTFLMRGMDVDAVDATRVSRDSMPIRYGRLKQAFPEAGKLRVVTSDFYDLDPEVLGGQYDLVIADQFLNHAPCADLLKPSLEKMTSLTKPGGKLWLRLPGAHDIDAPRAPKVTHDSGVTSHPEWCGCSGELLYEATSYFSYFAVSELATRLGFTTLSQTAMTDPSGGMNILYPESFNRESAWIRGDGTMTFFWEKRA